jgi:hypothetical protein
VSGLLLPLSLAMGRQRYQDYTFANTTSRSGFRFSKADFYKYTSPVDSLLKILVTLIECEVEQKMRGAFIARANRRAYVVSVRHRVPYRRQVPN